MIIYFDNAQNKISLAAQIEEKILSGLNTVAEQHELPSKTEVSVTLVTDEEIHQLNKQYRNVDRPTDVLSFALDEGDEPELINYYIEEFFKLQKASSNHCRQRQFREHFYGYVLVRLMQAMGAYGYRGYFERKDYFLQSIPLAVNNLRMIIENHPLPIELPHLTQVWRTIVESPNIGGIVTSSTTDPSTLTVTVESFSYKKGLPQDPSGNGGGFVFDCRALPNPGRYPEYQRYTGKDRPVIEFLQKEEAVDQFLENVEQIVSQSVEKYLERHFTHLMISFGCTGGQHRSVYCAERIAAYIRKKYPCKVLVIHREQG